MTFPTPVSSSLVSPRLYVGSDTYYFDVCNRPLVDLQSNATLIGSFLNTAFENYQTLAYQDQGVVNAVYVGAPGLGAALSPGMVIALRAAATNTGPATFSAVTAGVSDILTSVGPLQGGELQAGRWSLLAWTGKDWELLGSEVGTRELLFGQGEQPVVLGQLEGGIMSLSLGSTQMETLTTLNLSVTGTVDVGPASQPGQLVSYGQLEGGLGYQASLVTWNPTRATPLQVGQTAVLVASDVNSLATNVSCFSGQSGNPGQLYECTLVLSYPGSGLSPSGGLSVDLWPNNSEYSDQFLVTELKSSNTNQGQGYQPSSSTEFGVAVVSETKNSFHLGDVQGGSLPPFVRHFQVYTGTLDDSFGNPAGKLVTCLGGGGAVPSSTPGDGPYNGVVLSSSVWNNTSTNYSGLGTLVLEEGSSSQVSWLLYVTRIL